ncbi:MAG TPA: response regulator, partial [Chthoniobacterales bacterium]
AVDGDEALVLWERHADRVELVLTDWMMPGHLNGCELVRQLQTRRPGLEAIIVSGQSSEAFEEEARLDGPNKFLPKPYRLKCLAAMVHGCLRHAEAA